MDARPTYEELEQTITELNETLHRQEAKNTYYRNLVDNTSDSLYLVDADARYLFINNNHAKRLKISPEQAAGLSYRDFHSSEQTAEFAAKVKTVFETGRSLSDEHRSLCDDGYYLRTFSPVPDDKTPASILAVSIVSKDITARKEAEEALRQSEVKYRQLIEHSGDAIFVLTDGKICFANRQTEKMLGYPMDDLRLISFINLVLSEDREMVFERQKALLSGDPSAGGITFRLVNKAGTTIWVTTQSAALLWNGLPSSLNFMRDITGQKKSERRIIQAQKMESIGTLAGGIAHDFNNLLMGIQGHASLALLNLDKKDRNYQHFKKIETLVMSGASLTKQMLGFARTGKYEVKTTNINALVEKILRTAGRDTKDVHTHCRLEPDLWSTDIDQTQFEQVLSNLFNNAWQAMPGGGDIHIETKNLYLDESRFKMYSGKSGLYVKISITDTGVGMDDKTKERIFEPFFTTREMGRGTGLGLAAVYGIIKNHNGFINVYSEKGQGSTFNLYIPASARNIEDATAGNLRLTVPSGTETILLIDDEAMILDVAGAMLQTLGYKVIPAQNGASALTLYRKQWQNIDLIILDMILPDMSGAEVFDGIKIIEPHAKVLLASGYSLNNQAEKIMDRGCDGFIQKPFTLGEISNKLRDILGHHSDQQRPSEIEQVSLPIFDHS